MAVLVATVSLTIQLVTVKASVMLIAYAASSAMSGGLGFGGDLDIVAIQQGAFGLLVSMLMVMTPPTAEISLNG